ncbi:MAG: hypothetical protein KJ052_08210, partial [Candidatus Hydrogenedentes bacterium]|nr:hypothetical protein [Candidatus Hydrogenedentota bacterium]
LCGRRLWLGELRPLRQSRERRFTLSIQSMVRDSGQPILRGQDTSYVLMQQGWLYWWAKKQAKALSVMEIVSSSDYHERKVSISGRGLQRREFLCTPLKPI